MENPICRAIFNSMKRSDPAANGVPNFPDDGIYISPAVGVISGIPLRPDCVNTDTKSKLPKDVGKRILLPARCHVVDSSRPREGLPLSITFNKNIIPDLPKNRTSKKKMVMGIHLRATEEARRVGDIRNSIQGAQPLLDC